MNKIEINFHSGIDKYINLKKIEKIELPVKTTIDKLCKTLNLEGSIYLVLQNGIKANRKDVVKNNAKIDIYPIFGGG